MGTYSAWKGSNGKGGTLIAGDGPPRFVDGTLMPDCELLLWKFDAATFEEASAIHHLRMGDGGYMAHGNPAPCPKCGAMYYPEGSGECWRCGKIR
jgi:hypothetical protein